MTWDAVFWAWFAIAVVFFITALLESFSLTNVFLGFVIIGTGLCKISSEERVRVKIRKSILDKLKK
jgi:hypothetical protein